MMVTYTEFLNEVNKVFTRAEVEEDNYGQIIIYTGLKRQDDNPELLEDYEANID